jgi:hypothetical protein
VTGFATDCTRCALDLDATNITGVCLECKHIARAAAAGHTAPEVPIEEARANFMAVFRANFRQMDADVVYMPGACRKCGRFRARRDTGCCEWCSGPRRFPVKRKAANLPGAKSTRKAKR